MNPQNRLHMEFPNLPSNVGLARVTIASFASQMDFTLGELEEIRVAVSEAVSNAVIHAYPEGEGIITVNAAIEGGYLTVEVIDQGKGIEDVELAKTPAFSTAPERMGLGLVFMESFMDHLSVESQVGKGTRIFMRKRPEREQDGSNVV